MEYIELTPEMAKKFLENNNYNRNISPSLVSTYAKDIIDGNWDENVGSPISVDKNGILRNGQHRCAAVVEANKPIHIWLCKNVSENGIYDNNRKRSNTDQLMITRPDIEKVLRSTRAISVIRTLIQHEYYKGTRNAVSAKQIADYIDRNVDSLSVFFRAMPSGTTPKISIASVYLSLYLAYLGGISIKKITDYYAILASGMSSSEFEYPIIAFRNYLLNNNINVFTENDIARCQYSLKKYLTKSCTKRIPKEVKELIWKFPVSTIN